MDRFESHLARERYEQDCRENAAVQRRKKRQMTREERKRRSKDTMVKITTACFMLIVVFGILATALDL